MQDRLVFFATNRIYDGQAHEFGSVCCDPPGRLLAGRIPCRACDRPAEEGTTGLPEVLSPEDPDAGLVATLREWLDTAARQGAIPLLYTHGFNFKFQEAAARTAALCCWYEAAGAPPLLPFAFTWPSNGMGSVEAYHDDAKDAARSGIALARLIAAIASLRSSSPRPSSPRPARAPVYLAHSMGVRTTRHGMQAIAPLLPGLATPVFGQAFLMAGDDVADVLDEPWRALSAESTAGALRPVARLARHVTIGVNRDDGVVWLVSGTINRGDRLGARGPLHPADLPANVKVLDCSMAIGTREPHPVPAADTEPNWIGHQYFRNDCCVRADMVAALLADAAPEEVPGRRWGTASATGISEHADRLYPAA